jgi:hypothetical protein
MLRQRRGPKVSSNEGGIWFNHKSGKKKAYLTLTFQNLFRMLGNCGGCGWKKNQSG